MYEGLGKAVSGLAEIGFWALSLLGIFAAVIIPLGLWQLGEIIIWAFQNVNVSIS